MDLRELIETVKKLITTPETKDYTNIEDWIVEGDIDDMTAEEIAQEWDDLPMMDTETE